MGICCGNSCKEPPVIIRSQMHLSVEKCLEYKANNGTVILIDKEEYKLGDYFLKNQIFISNENGELNLKRQQDYLKNYTGFKKKIKPVADTQDQMDTKFVVLRLFYETSYKDFYNHVVKFGFPLKYRWDGWKAILDTKDIEKSSFFQLVKHKNEEVTDIVSKDVPRTFPANPFFKDKIEDIDFGREILHTVCTAIGNYFTEVGYTQGFNFLAGYFLQVSGGYPYQVFSVLRDQLIDDRFCLIGLYDNSFSLLGFMKFLIYERMKKSMPKLYDHLENIGYHEDIWITPWLLSFFTGFFPKYHVARFLDYILITDVFSIVGLVCAITHNLEVTGNLLAKDMNEVNYIFKNLISDEEAENANDRMLYEPEIIIKNAKELNFKNTELIVQINSYYELLDNKSKLSFSTYYDHFTSYFLSHEKKKSKVTNEIIPLNMKLFSFKVSQSELASVSHRDDSLQIDKRKGLFAPRLSIDSKHKVKKQELNTIKDENSVDDCTPNNQNEENFAFIKRDRSNSVNEKSSKGMIKMHMNSTKKIEEKMSLSIESYDLQECNANDNKFLENEMEMRSNLVKNNMVDINNK